MPDNDKTITPLHKARVHLSLAEQTVAELDYLSAWSNRSRTEVVELLVRSEMNKHRASDGVPVMTKRT